MGKNQKKNCDSFYGWSSTVLRLWSYSFLFTTKSLGSSGKQLDYSSTGQDSIKSKSTLAKNVYCMSLYCIACTVLYCMALHCRECDSKIKRSVKSGGI